LQAGRLLWIGFRGTSVTDEPLLAALAAEGLIGGVLLLARNVQDEAQLTRLCAQIHALTSPHRLGICIDQEGGRVSRLPCLQVPPARQVAAHHHPCRSRNPLRADGAVFAPLRGGLESGARGGCGREPCSPAIGAWQRSIAQRKTT
jgi:beta-N-acetylhexosaminidase